jgi:hypothetical protein
MGEYFQLAQQSSSSYVPISNVLVESSLNNKQSVNLEALISTSNYEGYSNHYQPGNFAPLLNSSQTIVLSVNENSNISHQMGFQSIENSKLDEVRYHSYYSKEDARFYQHHMHSTSSHHLIHMNPSQPIHLSVSQSNFKQNENNRNSSQNDSENEEDDEEVADQIFPWMKRAHGLILNKVAILSLKIV